MQVRTPDIRPQEGPLVWSKIPEFSLTYNAYSVAIPYFEYYMNSVINKVRTNHCDANPELADTLRLFVEQERTHAKYHERFNKRMFDAGNDELRNLVEEIVSDLKRHRNERSLAFNTAYCAGFESIATFAAKYLYEKCDEYFEGADPHGANLLLWHVAEEFEHRAVAHDAFHAVSGNYCTRIHGLLYAFWHVGGSFMRAESLVLDHYCKDMTEEECKATLRKSRKLFWRQLRYVAPRMLRIFLPWYNPAQIHLHTRIQSALVFYRSEGPITQRVELI